jgi:hypothetical protein
MMAKKMKELHADGHGIPYNDMACLYRNFKTKW